MDSKTLNNTVEGCILDYINERNSEGEYAQQQKIIDQVIKDCKISDKSVRDVLTDMVKRRKISTRYEKPFRYFGKPKISLPVKVCTAMITIILASYMIIDTLIPKEYIKNFIYLNSPVQDPAGMTDINFFPFVIFSIVIVIVISSIWYYDYRKVFK